VLRRIRWPRSHPHHGGVRPGDSVEPMASSARRSFAAVGSLFGAGTRLVVRRRQIWCFSPASAAGFAGFGSRSAWGMSPADSLQRQVPVLQAWSSVHNALKAMALAWISVCWFSVASSGVHLGGAGGQRRFQIGLFAGTPKDLFVIFFYFRVFSQSFLDTCQSWFFCTFPLDVLCLFDII
jgi:hypothetical protein